MNRVDIAASGIAVSISAAMRRGEPVFIDSADPLSILMAQEEAALQPPAPDRSDIASLLMGHLFGEGPHPERVTLRIYRLTGTLAPEMLRSLPSPERILLEADDDLARDERVRLLLRGTRIARRRPEAHQRAIRELMAAAWSRQKNLALAGEVPAAAIIGYGAGVLADRLETLAEFQVRQEAIVALLQFFFQDGPQPERVAKRVFMVAKAYFPPLVLRMSLQQLAEMFGQVRATWSWRGKKKLNGFLSARGALAVKAPYQKSDAVCVKYAAAAVGNRNRATGRRVA